MNQNKIKIFIRKRQKTIKKTKEFGKKSSEEKQEDFNPSHTKKKLDRP